MHKKLYQNYIFLLQGGFGVALTLGSLDEGIIPINKNLW